MMDSARQQRRKRAIWIVRGFLEGGFESEVQDEAMLTELQGLLPDPEFERFLFWGPEDPEQERFRNLAPEQIVDEALAYQAVRV